MVCLGNICRSPMAHGILLQKITERNLHVEIDSAGTAGYHEGELSDERTLAELHKNGIDLRFKKARKVQPDDWQRFDIIYAMDRQNHRDLIQYFIPEEAHYKVKLILSEWDGAATKEVPDPYYRDQRDFENVFSLLEPVCEEIASRLDSK